MVRKSIMVQNPRMAHCLFFQLPCVGGLRTIVLAGFQKKNYEIVTFKGLGSGAGSFFIALIVGEKLPEVKYILFAMVLGFVAYGLSIFTYIKAQRDLGAAKTSAFYSIAPFIR